MVKIKEYKIRKQGARGVTVTLPKVWLDDSNLTFGDKLEMYRDIDNRLIIVAKNEIENEDQASGLRKLMEEGR